MKLLTPLLLLLAIATACAAAGREDKPATGPADGATRALPADGATRAFERLLTAGPVDLPAPAFDERDRKKRAGAVLSASLLNADDWPAAGDGEDWLPGERLLWGETDASEGVFTLGGKAESAPGRVAWLAGYVTVSRWQKLTITATGTRPLVLFVDGKEKARSVTTTKEGDSPAKVSARCTLIRGKHRVLIKTVDLAEAGREPEKDDAGHEPEKDDAGRTTAWTITVAVKAGDDDKEAGPALSTSPVRTFADMAESKNLARIGGFALSPDGKTLAAVVSGRKKGMRESRRQLLFIDIPTGRRVGCIDASSGISALAWAPDGKSLAFRSGKDLKCTIPSTGDLFSILRGVKGLGKYVWSPDGKHIYYAAAPAKPAPGKNHYKLNGLHDRLTDYSTTNVLYVTPAAGGARHALTERGDFAVEDFALSPGGRRLAFVKRYPVKGRPWFRTEFWLLEVPQGEAKLLVKTSFPFENVPKNLTWSPDAQRIAFLAPPDQIGAEDRRSDVEHNFFETDLWTIDVNSKELVRVSDRFFEAVEAPLFWHPADGHIYFKAHHKTRKHVARVAADGTGGIELLTETPSVVSTFSAAAGGGGIAYTGSSIDRPTALYHRDTATGKRSLLLDPNSEFMSRFQLGEWERYDFTNSRGQVIDGYLFYPPDFDRGKTYPLIVYYYGGTTPEVERFSVTYYHYMPANGYMQYVVNPAGAYGYGEEFSDLHANDQGLLAGDDILEGVEKLIADHNFIDGDNVAGYGGSYGGFMTMSLITRTDRFKASCSMYGISNIASYWGAGIWGYTYGDTAMAKSYPWNRRDIFVDRAPLFNADKVQSALLLLHGTDDKNVPAVESEQMYTALEVLGKEVAYIRFPGEDHGIASSRDKYILHRRMIVEWFDKYLKSEPGAWEERWK